MRRVAVEVGFVAELAGAFARALAGGGEILLDVGDVGSAKIICGPSI